MLITHNSYIVFQNKPKSNQCFPVHLQSLQSPTKPSPMISPRAHIPPTELFIVPLPLVEKNITHTSTKDFAYSKTPQATTPKISSKITTNLWKVTARSTTTTQSLHFITRTSHDLWNISALNATSLSNSLLHQLQLQHQTPHHNLHHLHNPTTRFRATCSTK